MARAAYSDRSLVTRVGPPHADHGRVGDRVAGMPTSSATLPGLIVQMLWHAHVYDGADVLDVGTGSGYGCAVLARRLGDQHVTSVDVDAYLTEIAAERLGDIGLCPQVITCDATGPLRGTYDRIVSTVAVRPIPASWLVALRPSGRLVTTISGTALIITADKTDDGGAIGRTEWDRAGFMHTRAGADYPPGLGEPAPMATRWPFIKAARAGYGTSWMTSAIAGYGMARCPSTGPPSPSPQTASAT